MSLIHKYQINSHPLNFLSTFNLPNFANFPSIRAKLYYNLIRCAEKICCKKLINKTWLIARFTHHLWEWCPFLYKKIINYRQPSILKYCSFSWSPWNASTKCFHCSLRVKLIKFEQAIKECYNWIQFFSPWVWLNLRRISRDA